MSDRNPIPKHLHGKFVGYMQGYDMDDLSDGAWFAVLEDAAQQFIDSNGLGRICNNSAVHQYLRLNSKVKP